MPPISSPLRPCQSGALHLVSARFGDPFLGPPAKDAVVAQLVRAPVCGTGGRWFEPTQLYQLKHWNGQLIPRRRVFLVRELKRADLMRISWTELANWMLLRENLNGL